MNQKIVLIGAGSAQFGLEVVGDIIGNKHLHGSGIVLHDINPEALGRVYKIVNSYIVENELPYTVEATASRKEALKDAGFCVISIEVGDRFQLWEQDWRIPQQYGIRQVYGENGGPGGLFHSLRIIPPILEICEDIQKICPEAYVFNLSNPMSRICTTVFRKFPDLKFIGLCHEIRLVLEHLPKLLNTPIDELSLRAGGLNHFSIILEASYKATGKDAYPDIRKLAPDYFEDTVERDLHTEFLKIFGYLPITTDSHFGEYIQWAHDVVDHKGIIDFYQNYRNTCLLATEAEGTEYLGSSDDDHWGVVPIIEGILTDSGYEEYAVNVLNDGLIGSLPHDVSVEVPAIVNRKGVRGIKLENYPKGVAGLLRNHTATLDLTAEAILEGSKELVLQALLVDPVVDSVGGTVQMLDTMLELQKDYLEYIR